MKKARNIKDKDKAAVTLMFALLGATRATATRHIRKRPAGKKIRLKNAA